MKQLTTNILLVVSLLLLSQNGFTNVTNYSCDEVYEQTTYYYKKNKCNSANEVVAVYEYFSEDDSLYSISSLDDHQRIEKEQIFFSDGDSKYILYQYQSDSIIITNFQKNSEELIATKVEKSLDKKKTLRSWVYAESKLQWVDTYSLQIQKQITKRYFPNEGLTYSFIYKEKSKYQDEVQSFVITDEQGQQTGGYTYAFDGDVISILKSQFTGADLKKVLAQYANQKRLPVAIVDSGFDVRHKEITPYLANSSTEIWGSIDHDLNGLLGDTMGWSFQNERTQSANINEPVIIGGFKPFPVSHGTHVASIAMKNLNSAYMLGFSGDVSKTNYLKIVSKEFKTKKIQLANLSWGFKEKGFPFTPPIEVYHQLTQLISTNPQTLFHVAAGNSGQDLDDNTFRDYPANYAYNNLLVIGALNVSDYNWDNDKNLIPAIFKDGAGSNTGNISVDAFAPGKEVNGAHLGGGMIRKSGTSMASPMSMNATTKVLLEDIKLSTLKLKEIMLKTVGYSVSELPCLSRGFIHPKRSLATIKLLKAMPLLSIEDAVLKLRENKELYYPGEIIKPIEDLKRIWSEIDESLSSNTMN